MILRLTLVFVSVFSFSLHGQAQEKLEPGKVINLEFPELPPSFHEVNQANPGITTVAVRIPDHYSSLDTVPLFVFLEGGYGGNGQQLRSPLNVEGGKHYIAANFPLFKEPNYARNELWDGVGIDVKAYPVISHAYAVILDRINKLIPNIDYKRSVIGGHSNGAHTLSLLLTQLDERFLKSFQGIFMIDGGIEWSSYGRTKTLENHHILFIVGGGEPNSPWWRKYYVQRMEYYQGVAAYAEMPNWQFKVMPGRGHAFYSDYYPIIRKWMKDVGRDEKEQGE